MLPWRRFHLSYLITPRFSPACTGSGAVAALPVHDTGKFGEWPPKLHVRGHMELRHRFDLHLNDEVKKFLWILATLILDPRFKKLDFFKGCEDLIAALSSALGSRRVAAYRVRQELQEPCLRPDGGTRACHTRCGQLREWHHCAQEAEERVRLIFQRPRKFGRGG